LARFTAWPRFKLAEAIQLFRATGETDPQPLSEPCIRALVVGFVGLRPEGSFAFRSLRSEFEYVI